MVSSTSAAPAGRSSGDGRPEPLTPREREILQLFATGLGTAAIAQRLSISPVTVRNHAQRILAKLRVHSRLAAVARGYSLQLIVVLRDERETCTGW